MIIENLEKQLAELKCTNKTEFQSLKAKENELHNTDLQVQELEGKLSELIKVRLK